MRNAEMLAVCVLGAGQTEDVSILSVDLLPYCLLAAMQETGVELILKADFYQGGAAA
jgi:hypothetical protein